MKKIKIPKLPSESRMEEIAKEWFNVHSKINFFEWNDVLKNNSYPFHSFKIDGQLCIDCLNSVGGHNEITEIINSEVKKSGWENSFFIKLITRSPKDFLDGESFELKYGEQATQAIFNSMRCFEDLCLLVYLDKCIFIIRPYVEIPKEREFRVFVRDNKIVGISQYHYFEEYKWIVDNANSIESRIRNFVANVVNPNIDLDNYVADIVLEDNKEILLELNPYGLSDPCIFKQYDKLNGEFVYLKNL